MAVSSCRPRLYVYRLPEMYRDPNTATELPPDGIGTPTSIEEIPALLWDTEQYSLASLVYERSLAYRCRTHDPGSADLFIVPAFKSKLGTNCPEPSRSRVKLLSRLEIPLWRGTDSVGNQTSVTHYPHRNQSHRHRRGATTEIGDRDQAQTTLGRRGGADHIILSPRNGEPWDRAPYCDLQLGAHGLGAALYLSMEAHPHNASWVYPEGYCGKVCVRAYRPQLLSDPLFWSVPWPSMVHAQPTSGGMALWASDHARPILAAANFNLVHRPILPKPTLQLRAQLLESCRSHPAQCISQPAVAELPGRTALMYWQATFCLQPGGDTITRKGIIDSILLGCIPVLFHDGQLAQWPWHWGSWVHNATVLLNQSAIRSKDIDVIDVLATIPKEVVETMQLCLRTHAHRMQYSTSDTVATSSSQHGRSAPDAFDIILQGAWQLSKDAELQKMGNRLQKSNRGFQEVSSRRWELANALMSSDFRL